MSPRSLYMAIHHGWLSHQAVWLSLLPSLASWPLTMSLPCKPAVAAQLPQDACQPAAWVVQTLALGLPHLCLLIEGRHAMGGSE